VEVIGDDIGPGKVGAGRCLPGRSANAWAHRRDDSRGDAHPG